MNRVAECFELKRRQNQKVLIPYMMGGYPNLPDSAAALEILAEAGADLIEVGIPFSDPLADGPVIQAAGQQALTNGCTFSRLMQELGPVVKALPIPVMMMAYYNIIFQRGVRRFVEEIKDNGFSGVIVPDLPPEEADELRDAGREFEIGLSFLVAPTSTSQRIRSASHGSTGFIYAVSLKGVTGAREHLPPELPEFLQRIRRQTDKPVAVGFGIAQPWQAQRIAQMADGIIVGSAVIQRMSEEQGLKSAGMFLREMREAIGK
ncbi:MAG TPA: tryptophan synthase subunit alpha [Bacillota bacterium]|nr:tryptophan synthase subunit alpha [Bacillota bacterium]HPT88510.1 tryptophan synthase subunit alpha [Bacillota bacterium]